MTELDHRAWVELLEDEELAFLKRFVLASGSLKELAKLYGISYPTVRLRLDRLIAKVRALDSHRKMSRFERLVRSLHADGRLDQQAMKSLMAVQAKEREQAT